MKVSRKWIQWAHGPGAEDGQPLATQLVELAETPGTGSVDVTEPDLIAELVDVAGLYCNPRGGDALCFMGPWWMGQPAKIVKIGTAELRASNVERTGH